MDQHRHIRAPQLRNEPVHPGRVVPVTVAEHDDVDTAPGDVKPPHVLDESVRRDSRVEQDPGACGSAQGGAGEWLSVA
jgi:hypothetical protein